MGEFWPSQRLQVSNPWIVFNNAPATDGKRTDLNGIARILRERRLGCRTMERTLKLLIETVNDGIH
jgi:hypothetical protein